jgi:hypothetical protein
MTVTRPAPAGRRRTGQRPARRLATAHAANALPVSVPLAGPELGTAFACRRFTRQGADAPLAGWSLLAGWLVLLWLQYRKGARRNAGTARNRVIAHATAPGPGQRRGR